MAEANLEKPEKFFFINLVFARGEEKIFGDIADKNNSRIYFWFREKISRRNISDNPRFSVRFHADRQRTFLVIFSDNS